MRIGAAVRVATAAVNGKALTNGKIYSEKDWNTNSSVEVEPYRYSKVP